MFTINNLVIALMVLIPLGILVRVVYKECKQDDLEMADIRRMINYTPGTHDGSIEYVPVKSSRSTYLYPMEEMVDLCMVDTCIISDEDIERIYGQLELASYDENGRYTKGGK